MARGGSGGRVIMGMSRDPGREGGGGTPTDGITEAEGNALYVNVTGDTMTGFLTLSADPTAALHAATKQYVDANAGTGGGWTPADTDPLYVNVIGDTMTGPLTIVPAAGYSDTSLPGLTVENGGGASTYTARLAGTHLTFNRGNSRIAWDDPSLGPRAIGNGTSGFGPYASADVFNDPLATWSVAEPTAPNHATTKAYVDANAGGGGLDQATADTLYVNVSGDTMSGLLTTSSGIKFTSVGTSPTDLSKHIDLFGGVYGMTLTESRTNIVAQNTAQPGTGRVVLIGDGQPEIEDYDGSNSRKILDEQSGWKSWSGTQAQYDAIATKDPQTLYAITN